MTPYYQDDFVTIYHGDCREILPGLATDVVITDPVWPNAHPDLEGSERPQALASEALAMVEAKRLLVWLGCQSDPRFLECVPSRWNFLRMMYLRRAVPGYNGRCLVTGDVAYAFGEWPPSKPGRRVLPGEFSVTSVPNLRVSGHPAARNLAHAQWLVHWWTDETEVILDPFLGSGTTLVAAKSLQRKAIGIEIEEKYCEIAVKRMAQEVMAL